MKPFVSGGVKSARCCGMMERCEVLTKGTISGTWGSRRKFFALEKTARSAARNASSADSQQ
jgi:hypothetical protein